MKNIVISIAAFACVAAPVLAKTPPEMVVHASPSPHLNQWVEFASHNITQSLERLNMDHYQRGDGVTYVRFTCDENGKPANIKTALSSMVPGVDIMGRIAVRKVKSLHPIFAGAKPGQVFEAAIIFESDEVERKRLIEKVKQRAEQQNAYFATRQIANPVVSLLISRRT